MPAFCVVSNCEYKYAFSTNISFHKFPFHTPLLLNKWIEFVERDPNWTPSRWSRVCSHHFVSSDFKENIFRKCLKRNAVPSVKKKILNCPESYSFDHSTDIDTNIINEETLAANQLQSQLQIDDEINDSTTYNIEQNQQSATHKVYELICRLCAQTIFDINSDNVQNIDDLSIMTIFSKCFPTLTLELSEHFPNKICADCLMKLKQFSIFVERVQSVQCDFTNSNLVPVNPIPISSPMDVTIPSTSTAPTTTSTTTMSAITHFSTCRNDIEPIISRETGKAIVIKQEPFVNVKQEVIDFTRTGTTLRLQDNFIQNDAYCEFCDVYFINNFELKSHIVNYHSSGGGCRENATKTANNCEIMEIITLDNIMMIDLVDKTAYNQSSDTINDESPASPMSMPYPATILKVETLNDLEQRENLTKFILNEHNYCTPITLTDNITLLSCKPTVKVLKQEDVGPVGGVPIQSQHVQQQILSEPSQSTLPPIFEVFESIVETEESYKENTHHHIQSTEGPGCAVYDGEEEVVVPFLIATKVCSHCSEEFRDVYQYLLHKKMYHSRILPIKWSSKRFLASCQDCSATFHTKLAFTNHRNYMCPVRRGITYQCPHCRLNFVQWLEMRQHSKQCCRSVGGITQQQVIKLQKTIGVQCDDMPSIISGAIRYACEQCGRSFNRRCNLYRHKALHRPREQWDQKCIYCGTVFDKRLDLTRHISLGDCQNADKTMIAKLKAEKTITCQICNKKFRSANSLYQHKFTHSDVRRYKCTLCTKEFKRAAGLNQHIRGFHHKIKPHKCPVCKHSYSLKGDMNRCKHSILNNE